MTPGPDRATGPGFAAPDFASALRRIDSACADADLAEAVAGSREAVVAALSAHVPAVPLASAWSQVMSRAVVAARRAAVAEAPIGAVWFVSGSVGRGEALPGSDVESLIMLGDEADAPARYAALRHAAEVAALLERCGIESDRNGVIASRARFCRSLEEWGHAADRWCAEPGRDRGVVMAGLLADATEVAEQGAELRGLIGDAARRSPGALRAMLQDATAVRSSVPSRLRVFATNDDVVDLKSSVLEPVVKIARWAALCVGSSAASTVDRLAATAGSGYLDAADAQCLRECYAVLTRLRWRTRAKAWLRGSPVSDHISLAALSPQDRAALRAVAREVSAVRRKLAYLASASAFDFGQSHA